MNLGFTESKADSNLCFKVEGGRPVMLLLCVDALFSRHGGVVECGWNLPQQGKYVVEILKRFKMMDCKTMTTLMALNMNLLSVASSESIDATMYCYMIYSLMYLMNTRPDICFAVNKLRHVHLMVTKHVVR